MKIPVVNSKDCINVTDFTKDEITGIFRFAEELKKETLKGKQHNFLKGKTLGLIFEKSSTRTRVSFEVGIFQLGGHALFLSSNDIQLGRGETIADTARVLSRYTNGIMIRTYSHDTAVELARYADIPVINGLTDTYHPCQALSDYFTIYESGRPFSDTKIVYIGDANNVANSLLLGAAILGVNISIASPKKYMPSRDVVEKSLHLSAVSGAEINITNDINMAVEGANYIYTDVWVSMGQEKEAAKRRKDLAKYRITKKLLSGCAGDCKIMHCLPAHRGEEIDGDVMESRQSIIFEQAENRLHLQKALLCALMSKKRGK